MELLAQWAAANQACFRKLFVYHCLFAIGVCLLAGASSAAAAPTSLPRVSINGRTVPCQPPGIWQEGTAYLPGEFLSHFLGIQVRADVETGSWLLQAYGKSLRVRADETSCRLGYEVLEAQAAPILQQGHLYIPLGLLTQVYGITPQNAAPLDPASDLELRVPGASTVDVRCGSHPDKARVVIDLEGPAGYIWSTEHNALLVDVAQETAPPEDQTRLRLLTFDDEVVPRISQSFTADGFSRIIIIYNSPAPPRIFTLAEPARIVIDIPRPPPPPRAEIERAEGAGKPMRWQIRNFGTPRGPIRVYVLKIDVNAEDIMVRPALAGPTVHQRRSVLSIARQEGAVAALNGGFYAAAGPPLGLLIVDGEWIKPPLLKRTALGITSEGKLLMDNLDFDGRVYFKEHGYLQLTGLNQGHGNEDGLVVYTPRWGKQLQGSKDCTRLAISASGEITLKETEGSEIEIPPGGFVISGRGKYAELLARVEPGEEVTLKLSTKPAWDDVRHALGAGPRLVKDGKITITAREERFRWDVARGIYARSAVGITKAGELLLVAVEPAPDSEADSEADSNARGMSLEELATTMVKLGAWQAMNLDGGGSSTVVENGQVLNRPVNGWLRQVSNALVVIAESEKIVKTE